MMLWSFYGPDAPAKPRKDRFLGWAVFVVAIGILGEQAQSSAQSAKKGFVPKDPWRKIDGVTNYAGGPNWVRFYGKVLQVTEEGVRVKGEYRHPSSSYGSRDVTFFVSDFPYVVADGEDLSYRENLVARESGTYTYPTAIGSVATVRKLEYGFICGPPLPPPPSAQEQAAAKAAEAKRKADQASATLKHHQELAAKKDPYGLYRMGKRYLEGDGVEKDPERGWQLLRQASLAGHEGAKELLEKKP
jgi:hypothetical protein